jgi:xanthine dehydrogenase accessory factor
MTPGGLAQTASAWLAQGREVIDVLVSAHRGSVPREAGTHMVVTADALAGTIGGGHLELRAIAAARSMLQRGEAGPLELDIPLGPALGQCCGGRVQLRLQRLTPEGLAGWPTQAPRFVLQLHGAGHVGRAVVQLLAGLPCRVQWVDEREDGFPMPGTTGFAAQASTHIQCIETDCAEAEVALAPPGSCYLVMTHRHDLDLRICEAILRRADFRFFGLIGSATKRANFCHRLGERGFDTAALERITCPIGLPGIDGKEPEVIALAVVAQLMSLPQTTPPASQGTSLQLSEHF